MKFKTESMENGTCPFCNSTYTKTVDPAAYTDPIRQNWVYLEISCLNPSCRKEWFERYKLMELAEELN